MTDSKHTRWSTTALLITAFTVMVSTGIPKAAHAAGNAKADGQTIIKVRKDEEHRLKKQDKLYSLHAKQLAKQYTESAKFVTKQGGNAQPLLEAAEYFRSESKIK